MLEHLGLKNFKRFIDLSIDLAPLTVLTGVNSGGKSSVIQGLLLLSTASRSNTQLHLNGPYGLRLGEAADVLAASARSQEIALSARSTDGQISVSLAVPDDRSTSLLVTGFAEESRVSKSLVASYLSAERLGPRDVLEMATTSDNLQVGESGQYTAHVIAGRERSRVDPKLVYPESAEQAVLTLQGQIEAWMKALVGPLQLAATWIPGSNAATLRFRAPDGHTEWLRPANVGFGITYVLPVVTSLLTAVPGRGCVIIDSPESHLHPRAQSLIGQLLARAAGSGLQVIVETHSEHVLNGIRLGVARDGILPHQQVLVHYFGESDEPVEVRVSRSGGLSTWPSGFFDQTEADLAALSRVRDF